MPVDERRGADDCKNLKDRREPAIKLDKEPAIAVCESNTATQLAPQNNQLMSKRRILSFKPQLRLEWRGQDGKSETEQPDHFASLGDFITSSTRISFRYTQGVMDKVRDILLYFVAALAFVRQFVVRSSLARASPSRRPQKR